MKANNTIRELEPILVAAVTLIVLLLVLTNAQKIMPQNSSGIQHVCSSYGMYPMSANPSTSELCEQVPYGKQINNTLWAAAMTNNKYMTIAYFANGGTDNAEFVTNVIIAPYSVVGACAPKRNVTASAQCLFVTYGEWDNASNISTIYTEINGYQIKINYASPPAN